MSEKLIRLFEDSKQPGACRGCGARLEWFETLNGKQMPMNAGAVPRKSEQDPQSWSVVAFYSAEDSHWHTCPDRAQFSRRTS
jgi:hypothetical protein